MERLMPEAEARSAPQDDRICGFIAGRGVEADRSFAVENPATEATVAMVGSASPETFEAAVVVARAAFDSGPWPRMPAAERAATVTRFADELDAQRRDLSAVTIAETGCPRSLTEAVQVGLAIENLRQYADIALRLPEWEYNDVPLGGHFTGAASMRLSIRRWEAVGVVAAMTPYNFPLFTTVNKIAPALLAGCTVVLRPSPLAPLAVLAIAAAADRAGIPAGVLGIVVEDGIDGGRLLCEHRAVDAVSFTGSTGVGRVIAAQAAGTVKRVILELGGKSVQLYLDDALSAGPGRAVAGATGVWTNHAGQACSAQTRMLVPHARKQEVLDALAQAAAGLQVGDPQLPQTQVGPLISRAHRDSCLDLVSRAVDAGARVVTGGAAPANCDRGWFMAPTVLEVDDNANPAAQAEIFGPCVTVQGFGDVDEAVAIANDSDYGLSGGVYTADLRRGFDIAHRIHSGTVNVNSGWSDPYTPFGGVKQSGLGVERSELGFREYQYAKHIAVAPL